MCIIGKTWYGIGRLGMTWLRKVKSTNGFKANGRIRNFLWF